jgi:hypothetical protein
MRAKILACALLALILTTIHLVEAQQGKVYHIGVLSVGDTPSLKGFRDGLKGAGYVEGKKPCLGYFRQAKLR